MQEYMEKITHTLIKSFNYAYSGEQVSATSITIKAPSNNIMQHVGILEQEVASSFMNLKDKLKDEIEESKKNEDGKQQEDTNESAIQILLMITGTGANLVKCMLAFREILCAGNTTSPICLIDEQEKMIKPIFDKMSTLDTKIMLGRYITNFIVASLST
jgi:hypothetical protein